MTDSYIDLNIEHYLRNGELKGATRALNNIIHGEESNKSLTELIVDLKELLNYANWGYWDNRYNANLGKILPLKEAVIRSTENSVNASFLYQAKIVYKGNDMYCDLEEFLNEKYPYYMMVGVHEFKVEYAIKEFSNDKIRTFRFWYGFSTYDYTSDKYEYTRHVFNLDTRKVKKYSYNYSRFDDYPKNENGLYKIGTWTGNKKPTVVTFRKYPIQWDKYGARGRAFLLNTENNRILKSWDWEGVTNEARD